MLRHKIYFGMVLESGYEEFYFFCGFCTGHFSVIFEYFSDIIPGTFAMVDDADAVVEFEIVF